MGARTNRARSFIATLLIAYGMANFLIGAELGMAISRGLTPHGYDPAHGFIYTMSGRPDRFYTAHETTQAALAIWPYVPFLLLGVLIAPYRFEPGWRRFTSMPRFEDPGRVGRWGGLAGLLLSLFTVFVAAAPLIHWLNAMGVVLRV